MSRMMIFVLLLFVFSGCVNSKYTKIYYYSYEQAAKDLDLSKVKIKEIKNKHSYYYGYFEIKCKKN